jgi:hypothetical protein
MQGTDVCSNLVQKTGNTRHLLLGLSLIMEMNWTSNKKIIYM